MMATSVRNAGYGFSRKPPPPSVLSCASGWSCSRPSLDEDHEGHGQQDVIPYGPDDGSLEEPAYHVS
jgi:hypothetical protein